MSRATRILAILTSVGVGLAAVGCGGDDDSATSSGAASTDASAASEPGASAPPPPQSSADDGTAGAGSSGGECPPAAAGGELTFAVRSDPSGLDPYVGPTSGSLGGSERIALFDTIMRYDPDEGQFEPRMAESLESNEDATEWTLTLRDDVTFGNGEPVDTSAVQFTVNRHRAEDSTSLARTAASTVESMEIVDDRTMVFHLSDPWGNFASLLAGPVGMPIDPEAFQQMGAEQFAADPAGAAAGPFRLVRWAQGEELVLEARDDYWGGQVCIETLRFKYTPDDVARYEAFQSGQYDAAYFLSPQVSAQAREDGVPMYTVVTNGGYIVQINHGARGTDRPGADERVRKAIAYAIDTELINERAYDGLGMPDSALVPESSLLYSPGLEGPPYDPERARALLEEAKADGFDGSVDFICNSVGTDRAIAIEALLESVGFTVELNSSMSVEDWLGRVNATDYEISCGSLGGLDAQPWPSMAAGFTWVDSPASTTGYDSPAMVDAMQALRAARTPEERQEAFAGVQEVWNDEVPHAVVGHFERAIVWREGVEGIEFTSDLIGLFDQARVTN